MVNANCKVNHVDFYQADWLGGTVGLTLEERGFYITACAMIYQIGDGVPIDDLRRACSVDGRVFKRVLGRLVEAQKLEERDGKIYQKRCAKELAKAVSRLQLSRSNGAKGGRHSSNSNALAEPAGFQAQENGPEKDSGLANPLAKPQLSDSYGPKIDGAINEINGLAEPGGSPTRARVAQQLSNAMHSSSKEDSDAVGASAPARPPGDYVAFKGETFQLRKSDLQACREVFRGNDDVMWKHLVEYDDRWHAAGERGSVKRVLAFLRHEGARRQNYDFRHIAGSA